MPSQPISCTKYLPEAQDATAEGCPVRTKRRHIPVNKGIVGTAVWTMRLPNGEDANFEECLTAGSISETDSVAGTHDFAEEIRVRFAGCDPRSRVLGEVKGDITDAASGQIEFPLPKFVANNAGVFQFQAAVLRNSEPIFIDGGLISVERGLWGNVAVTNGPPTIQEIRFFLKDRVEENTLLQAVEFDDAEILEAIRWPVMQFNERSPRLSRTFNCNSFPYHYHWILAISGRLLTQAAVNYMRNKMMAQGGGMVQDDKNKDADYARMSQLYLQEWDTWLTQKKVELNAAEGWSTLGGYGGDC